MGGGWGKQGSGVRWPLGPRRVACCAVGRVRGPGLPARHCWVADAVDGHGVKRPGLLVEWRQAAAGWEGRVDVRRPLRPPSGSWSRSGYPLPC